MSAGGQIRHINLVYSGIPALDLYRPVQRYGGLPSAHLAQLQGCKHIHTQEPQGTDLYMTQPLAYHKGTSN